MALQTERLRTQRVYSDSASPGTPINGTSGLITGTAGQMTADAAYNIYMSGLDKVAADPGKDIDDAIDEIASKMIWDSLYTSGKSVSAWTMVRDNGWTMVSLAATDDPAAPQLIGSKVWPYDGTPTEETDTASVIRYGNRYVFTNSLQASRWRVYTKAGHHYIVNTVRDPDGTPIYDELLSFTALTDGWQTFNVDSIANAGEVIDFGVTVQNPDPAPVETIANYDYQTPNPSGSTPTSGQIVHPNQATDSLRIHNTDNDGTDRASLLASLTPGDNIKLQGVSWVILSSSSQGTYYDFGVSPATQASPTGVTPVTFSAEADQLISSFRDPGYWATSPYSAYVQGFKTVDGGLTIYNDDAFAIDVELQELSFSSNWDIVSPATSGGGGGTAPGESALTQTTITTAPTPAKAHDPDVPEGPWEESGNEDAGTLTSRRTDIQADVDLRAGVGGKVVFPPGLFQINGRIIHRDGIRIEGAGINKSQVRMKNYTGTVADPEFGIAPYQLEECMKLGIDPPAARERPKWQKNVSQLPDPPASRLRPQWHCETNNLSIHGGHPITDTPASTQNPGNTADPIDFHGIALYEGYHRARHLKVTNCSGYGVLSSGGYDARAGEKTPVDGEESLVEYVHVDKCLGGFWFEGGDDHMANDLIASTCRDFGLKVSVGSLKVTNVHVYGCNDGLLLDADSPATSGQGANHFFGLTELENCYRVGLWNRTHNTTSFQYLKMYGNRTDSYYSNQLFRTDIDLEASIQVTDLFIDSNQTDRYSIQLRDGSNGTYIQGGRIALQNAETRGVFVGNSSNNDIKLGFTGAVMKSGLTVNHASAQNNVFTLFNAYHAGPTLEVYAIGSNNTFIIYGGDVNVQSDQTTFESAGNQIVHYGRGSVNYSATMLGYLAPQLPA